MLTLVAAELSGSVLAGVGSALLFAGSYTFWSQSIIAEVYALHILAIGLTLGLLLRWEQRPTLARLGAFFAVYAIAFGNHLSMILLAPAYTFFLLASAPRGWRSLVTWPVTAIALTAATAGALQYALESANALVRSLPAGRTPGRSADGMVRHHQGRLAAKPWPCRCRQEWRATTRRCTASTCSSSSGGPESLLGAIGLAALVRTNGRRAALLATAYLVNALFAYSYNVGDAHVFYLPSHLMIALLAAPGAVLVAQALMAGWARLEPDRTHQGTAFGRMASSAVALAGVALIGYAGVRIYRDYPALDRSEDRRPAAVLSALTAGIDVRSAILLTDLNWQVQNGLSYYASRQRPEIAYARLADVLLYAPALVRDNFEIGRDVALTAGARDGLIGAYGPLIPTVADARVESPGISDLVRDLAPGTPIRARRAQTVAGFHAGHRRSEPCGCGVERRSAGVDAGRRLRRAGRSHRRTALAGRSARLDRSGAGSV